MYGRQGTLRKLSPWFEGNADVSDLSTQRPEHAMPRAPHAACTLLSALQSWGFPFIPSKTSLDGGHHVPAETSHMVSSIGQSACGWGKVSLWLNP